MTGGHARSTAQRVRAALLLGALFLAAGGVGCGGASEAEQGTTPRPAARQPDAAEAPADRSGDGGASDSSTPAQANPRALSMGATFGDLVTAVRTLDGLGASDSASGCLLRGGPLSPYVLEADLASAVHPIPEPPGDLEARLDGTRSPVVVLTRWAQHGTSGDIALVALSATPPPRPGPLAVVLLTREGAHLRRTDAAVPAAHSGPFPVARLGEHLPIVLEGTSGVLITAEARVPLSTLRAALGSVPGGSPPVILGLALLPGVRLPTSPAPDPSVHGLCPDTGLPAPAAGQRVGELSPDVLRAHLASMGEGAMRCFEFARGDAARGGRMRVLTRIGAQGRVTEACAASDELGDPTLRTCVLGVVRGVVFPAPVGGDYVDVALPLRLTPDHSAQQRPLCDG